MKAYPASAGALGPPDKILALRAQADRRYPFIVRFVDPIATASPIQGLDPTGPNVTALGLINGIAVTLEVSRAFELAEQPGVVQVWYLHPELAPLYIRTIQALDYNVRTLPLPSLVNLSIGPMTKFWASEPYKDEPMHAATQAAAEAGLIPVIAIGNNPRAEAMPGWINPWCWPEWVICVGAYDPANNGVADFSARGAPDRPDSWPDVVADGIDVIGPYPANKAKSAQRKRYDEANARFRELIPREKWDVYTLESGTSQATALVSAAAAQILHFLKGLIADTSSSATGRPLFSLTASPERVGASVAARPRLTGTAMVQADGSVIYEYPLDLPWKMVKQLLVDTALPLDGAKPYEVGAGLVNNAYVQQQFGQFGLVEIKVFPSKVLDR